ncbi:MAG TPA: BON domain-containing protein [Terriglobales bacterium]|nr:BON domain-containing protein [Terriglobales bacterium]
MKSNLLTVVSEELEKERRALVEGIKDHDAIFRRAKAERESQLEELAKKEHDTQLLEHLDDREQERIRVIDNALARIEAGTFGSCERCGRFIDESRLRTMPTVALCEQCSAEIENQPAETEEHEGGSETVQSAELPPDLDRLDDQEAQEYLTEMVRENGNIDMQELDIEVREGVVYLEGALPSEAEHEVLFNILTDVAGVQQVVDRITVQRLAWERKDRSESQRTLSAGAPRKVPDQEPYGGTENIILTEEEGVDYEPPLDPPPPPNRKD